MRENDSRKGFLRIALGAKILLHNAFCEYAYFFVYSCVCLSIQRCLFIKMKSIMHRSETNSLIPLKDDDIPNLHRNLFTTLNPRPH